ncbi:MAG TPA: AI-2E family transporter, partial [Roseiarcus sp.]|nr:AI-2E family transporter [Roseiarcus sp.]
LEKCRIPRFLAALLLVVATAGVVPLVIAVISAPLSEWMERLPELGSTLKDKLQLFDGLAASARRLLSTLGVDMASDSFSLPLPSFDWVRSTVVFLTPTLTEFLFFLVVLLLFLASWPDVRRELVMTFARRESRLTALKIFNEIESSLAGYLLMVTLINLCVGVVVGLICALTATPDPIGLGVLAATLNYIPIIGPITMILVLLIVGIASSPTLGAGLVAALAFLLVACVEGQFVTPAIIGRRLSLNGLSVILSLAFWTWLWGPMGAFLSSPLLIVALILKEHLVGEDTA